MAKEVVKTNQQKSESSVAKLRALLSSDSVREQFENSLKENTGAFVASVIDLYASDKYLQECNPNKVMMEALKAATLKLPINKQLGFAYIVPYKTGGEAIPTMQIGYRGYIQLAMRTGQYRHLNAGEVHEGVKVNRNLLTGEVSFSGEKTGDKVTGFFAYMELLNGFSKTLYMTHAEVEAHAKRYSKSFNSQHSAWKTHFNEMAMKTVIRLLLSKYGILSTDMISALTADMSEQEDRVEEEIAMSANDEYIDVEVSEPEPDAETEAPPEYEQQKAPF